MYDQRLSVLASIGLAVGGILGMTGTFAPSAALRGLAWGIDGVALVMAGAILTVVFYRAGQDFVASGFLVFAIGEGIILSGAAMDLDASIPSFGAGSSLWATALALISLPLSPISSPLPFFVYPLFVATFFGWIWTLLKAYGLPNSER